MGSARTSVLPATRFLATRRATSLVSSPLISSIRMIENESWAKKSEEGASNLYKGQLVGAAGLGGESEDDY